MKTRFLVRLESNETTLDNSIPTNEQPNKNIDDMLETAFHGPIFNEISKLPKMKQKLQDGDITTDEYNIELNSLKDRLAGIVKKMNIMRDSIKAQDKNIKMNQSILPSLSRILKK